VNVMVWLALGWVAVDAGQVAHVRIHSGRRRGVQPAAMSSFERPARRLDMAIRLLR